MLKLAIVGRPNVGKSTLFNRLSGRRAALVSEVPGTTRDVKEGTGELLGLSLKLFDTAGLEMTKGDQLAERAADHAAKTAKNADVILFLIDGREPLTLLDRSLADLLRKLEKPVVLVANKCETQDKRQGMIESYKLGFGDPTPISAQHGEGMGDLYEMLQLFDKPEEEEEESEESSLRLAIVGRPNAGKSTLVNALIGEERVLVSDIPGTTRDSITVGFSWQGKKIELVDTAGMRKQAKVTELVEKLSVGDARRAIGRAHVALLVTDADAPLEKQDLTIASQVIEEGRALVIAVNKWDLVEDKDALLAEIQWKIGRSLFQAAGVAVLPISALRKKGFAPMMKAVQQAATRWETRISTAKLNRWFTDVTSKNPPPIVKGKKPHLGYITQVTTRPPTFVMFASRASTLPDSYLRYLTNSLRESFDLPGIPIRLYMRKKQNPYES